MSGLNIFVKTCFVTDWAASCFRIGLEIVIKIKWCFEYICRLNNKTSANYIAVGLNYTKRKVFVNIF